MYCLSAPTAPPQNFSAFNTSSTSIRVTWDPLPLEHRRGIVLGYRIFYQKSAHKHRVARSIQDGDQYAEGNSLSSDLVGLEKFANYCVWALAFNRIGVGNETKKVCISTNEDGMNAAFAFYIYNLGKRTCSKLSSLEIGCDWTMFLITVTQSE